MQINPFGALNTKSETFSVTTDSNGNALVDTNPNHIVVGAIITSAYYMSFPFEFVNNTWYLHVYDILTDTRVPSTAVSGTYYYLELS